MDIQHTTLLVIGGGPGGYITAIRAAQLGIATTLVEGEQLGGTCLNVGCIPSKAMIHAADAFHQARTFMGDSTLGIHVEGARIDIGQTVRWKDGIVARLTGGVGVLLKKHGVKVVKGWATMVDGKTVDVVKDHADTKPVRIQGEHMCWLRVRSNWVCPACRLAGASSRPRKRCHPTASPRNW